VGEILFSKRGNSVFSVRPCYLNKGMDFHLKYILKRVAAKLRYASQLTIVMLGLLVLITSFQRQLHLFVLALTFRLVNAVHFLGP